MSATIDLTGQKLGRLKIIRKLKPEEKPRKSTKAFWLCECDCGNEVKVEGYKLRTGHTQSCGCYMKDRISETHLHDLTGKEFGYWTVLERAPDQAGQTYWKCRCKCGTIKNIYAGNLTRGLSKSCGCRKESNGEEKIRQLLTEANVPFEQEYVVKIGDFNKRFDFFVDNKYMIEFDGQQHFEPMGFGGDNQEKFKRTKVNDELKNQWCKDNNIPIIRIPYTKLNTLTIDDLLLKAE